MKTKDDFKSIEEAVKHISDLEGCIIMMISMTEDVLYIIEHENNTTGIEKAKKTLERIMKYGNSKI